MEKEGKLVSDITLLFQEMNPQTMSLMAGTERRERVAQWLGNLAAELRAIVQQAVMELLVV